MIKQINKPSRGLILGFILTSLLTFAVITFMVGVFFGSAVNPGETQNKSEAAADQPANITTKDIEQVKTMTNDFFTSFQEGHELSIDKFNEITYKYMNNRFLENSFNLPHIREKLFNIGYNGFTKQSIYEPGETTEGNISNFSINDTRKDNVHKTITTYLTADNFELNEKYWIEWREIPGEGWKIHAISFDSNIEALSKPLSPKRSQ